ncbi:MAG: hypothetical protein Q9165_005744 [Trypethelium subeluteriae]
MTDATPPPAVQLETERRPDQNRTRAATLPPPAQPVYVLRGHNSPIHAVAIIRHNSRLLTGDADGWVSLWSLATKRAVAVWRAHQATILGLKEWGDDNIITQGRDARLVIWQLRMTDEPGLEKKLPVEGTSDDPKQPWMLHSLTVNTINFCAFSVCSDPGRTLPSHISQGVRQVDDDNRGLLAAVPAATDGQIDVFHLPSQYRLSTIPSPRDAKTGMVMTVQIFHQRDTLLLAAGYENGDVALYTYNSSSASWVPQYHATVHSQPVLSVDVAPSLGFFYSSSADAIIAQHPLMTQNEAECSLVRSSPVREIKTKHSGQQALSVRSDEKILATAGWDSRIRVYSAKTLKELAVLKWHKEGCYALSFATMYEPQKLLATEDDAVDDYGTLTADQRREVRVKSTHWLVAGSKDGKVSLWDIY